LQLNSLGTNAPPKLKIKIGSDIMETSGASDLPPKKRHHIAAPPSYQDLKRESMNFRKQMMETFSEQKKTKEEKREKKEKKKKKKEKKRSVEIVSKPISEGAPVKLILKIGSRSANTSTISPKETSQASDQSVSELNKTAPSLKLKISRKSQGNSHSYNIQNAAIDNPKTDASKSNALTNPSIPPASPNASTNPNTLVTSTPVSTNNNNNNNNNNNSLSNLQPPVINDTLDISSLTTKKLEVSLERLEDVEKAKQALANRRADEKGSSSSNATTTAPASKDCEVR